MHERALRSIIVSATRQYEAALARSIHAQIDSDRLERWRQALVVPRQAGLSQQSLLWAAPAKHSPRQIEELLERIETLYNLGVQRHLVDMPDDLLRRYARRLANRPPSIGARIKEPVRTIEAAFFLRYCLLIGTDRVLLMVRRRVADLWRRATKDANQVLIHWADLYRELLASIGALAIDTSVSDTDLRERLRLLVAEHQQRKPPTRAQLVRDHLTIEIQPVRSLLSALMALPWEAIPVHPVLAAMQTLKALYEHGARELPTTISIEFGKVWRARLSGTDREQAFRAFEVATLLALRRALRNGTEWVDHSLAFRSRERLFIPAAISQRERGLYYRRLSLSERTEVYLEPLIERAQAGVAAVAKAVEGGELRIDDELHLTPLAAEEEEPELVKLRAALDHRIGEAQLPELLLDVDANVRFSWIMLGREPRSDKELLMVYTGILAHGTSMSAAETARMMPQLSAASVRLAMRWAGDERRLAEASAAVLGYLRRHAISASWGRSDLASSDVMSLETRQRVWQARLDPRRQTPSVGIYSHVLASWGHLQRATHRAQRTASRRSHRGRAATRGNRHRTTRSRYARIHRFWNGVRPWAGFRSVPEIEGTQGSAPLSAAWLRGAADIEADLRGQLEFQPRSQASGSMGPSDRLCLQRSHQRHQCVGALRFRCLRRPSLRGRCHDRALTADGVLGRLFREPSIPT